MIKRLLPHPDSPRHPVRGMLIYMVALLLFACMDAISKYLALRYPVALVAWMRYVVHLALMTAVFLPFSGRSLVTVQKPVWVIVRGACLGGITLFMLLALRRLPLAEATSVVYIAPLIVVLLARPLLKERIGVARLSAVVIGFLGAMLIVRPGGDLDGLGVMFALLTALCMTSYQLLTRLLSEHESAVSMLYYSALVGTVAYGLSLPWVWFHQWPQWLDCALFLSFGTLGFLGHLCFTLAFRDTQASRLSPLSYFQLVWSVALGWLIFRQTPSLPSIVGMCIVACSGMVVAMLGNPAQKETHIEG